MTYVDSVRPNDSMASSTKPTPASRFSAIAALPTRFSSTLLPIFFAYLASVSFIAFWGA